MEKEISDIIAECFKGLPEEVRLFLSSDEFVQKVKESTTSTNLSRKQVIKLENETVLVLLGMSRPEEFPSYLEKELNITTLVAIQLAMKIDKRVFSKFRDHLNEVYFKKDDEQENAPNEMERESDARVAEHLKPPQEIQTETTSAITNIAEENLKNDASYKPTINPTAEQAVQKTYQGVDPYREPIEQSL
jgi:hypothetical protein